MQPKKLIPVSVAYARPDRQIILNIEVPEGTSLLQALKLSGIETELSGATVEEMPIGVFGQQLTNKDKARPVKANERIEVYRALIRKNRQLKS